MGIRQEMLEVAERQINEGWRIRWIGPVPGGAPKHTPLSLALSLIGIVGFLASCALAIWVQPLCIIGGPVSLLCVFAGLFLARRAQGQSWIPVPAQMIDVEIREYREGGQSHYSFRLLCEFEFDGRRRQATPACSKMVAMRSEAQVRDYLARYIDQTGKCRIWIDPTEPVRATFPDVPWL